MPVSLPFITSGPGTRLRPIPVSGIGIGRYYWYRSGIGITDTGTDTCMHVTAVQ